MLFRSRLDPRTLQPTAKAAAAMVVAADGTLSDALVHAVFVLGGDGGLALLARTPGAWGVVATRDADGQLRVQVSRGHETAFHPARR